MEEIAAAFLEGTDIEVVPPGSTPIDTELISGEIFKKEFFLTRRTKATDLLVLFDIKKIDMIAGDAYFKRNNTGLKIRSYSRSLDYVGIKSHRLLSVALSAFAGMPIMTGRSYRIHISLPEYAYAIHSKHYDRVKEEELAAKKKEDRKLTRKEVKAVLRTIEKMEILSETDSKDTAVKYIPIASYAEIEGDDIQIEFDSRFLAQMARSVCYPTALLRFDARSPLTYALGEWLYGYSTFRSSRRKIKQNDTLKLKIDRLLTHLPICSADDKALKKHGWSAKIRVPLEKALKNVIDAGLIADWDYLDGCVFLKKESAAFSNLKSYLRTYILYSIKPHK